MISNISDLTLNLKFGACSELSFTAYKEYNGVKNPYYDKLQKGRLIHLEGFGYFVVNEYSQNFSNRTPSKSIKAYSAEYLLNNKGVNLTFITSSGSTHTYSKSYKFWDILPANQPNTLLGQLVAVAPQWSIGYVSSSLCAKYRSFDATEDGLYGFLVNTVSSSYEALFVFDYENYKINAYDKDEIVKRTDIIFTFDNITKSISIDELNNDIYTVLNVSGSDNLTIARVNPNGTKKIFCLDYYVGSLDENSENYYVNYNNWIDSVDLRHKVLLWQKATKDASTDTTPNSYGWLISKQKQFNKFLLTQRAKYVDVKTEYEIAQTGFSNYANDGSTHPSGYAVPLRSYYQMLQQALEYNLNVVQNGGRLYRTDEATFKQKTSLGSPDGELIQNTVYNDDTATLSGYSYFAISALNTEIQSLSNRQAAYVEQYNYESYFTDAEKLELEPYLREGNFQDDSFIVTDTMNVADYSDTDTYVETTNGLKQIKNLAPQDVIIDATYVTQQLLNAGYEKLETVAQPSYSFSMSALNFLFSEKFKPFVSQLSFGSMLNVEVEEGVWVYPYLQEISINYENPDNFTMKFGSRFRLSTAEWTWAELHNETSNAVNSVGSLLSATAMPVVNGTIDKVTSYMNNTLIAANQSIQSTSDNDFSFGGYGIRGRKKSSDSGNINGYSPEQIWISNNKINFTEDGWQSTKAMFGKLNDGNYGLIADSLVGRLIAGNNLTISNASSSFTVDGNGATLTNASLSITNDKTTIVINPSDGIKITDLVTHKDAFYVNNSGKLIADDVYVTSKDTQSLSTWMGRVEKALSDAASGIAQAQAAATAAQNAANKAQSAADEASNAASKAQSAADTANGAANTANEAIGKANQAINGLSGKLNATTAAVNSLFNAATFTAHQLKGSISLEVGSWYTSPSNIKYVSSLGGYVAFWQTY